MNPFVLFMVSNRGRLLRIAAGIALVAWSWLGLRGTTGLIVALVGVIPLVAGLFDFCLFSPVFGQPLSGPKIRAGE